VIDQRVTLVLLHRKKIENLAEKDLEAKKKENK
jgi:hypothetical protein